MSKEHLFFIIYMTIEGILGKTRFESIVNLVFMVAMKYIKKIVSKIKELL